MSERLVGVEPGEQARPSGMSRGIDVVVIGSPFGADQIAWQIAAPLAARGYRVAHLDRPGLNLLPLLAATPSLVLIDALLGGRAGEPQRLQLTQLLQQAALSSHQIGVAEALALAAALDQLPAELTLIGIAIGDDPNAAVVVDEAALLALLPPIAEVHGESIKSVTILP